MNGYIDKLAFIDLTTKKVIIEALGNSIARKFLGGYGIGSKILYEKQKLKVDPLGEYNTLGILAGPLTGTPLPFVSRYTVVSKSPLTETWGDANSRGFFGPYLKFSGFDGIFINGISDKPVYILLENGKVSIYDALSFWGKDTYETEDLLKSKYGKKAQIACIGPAGEKLSKISAIITSKGKAAGRSGMGAVMGSKKLKAIVALGGKKVPIANTDLVEELNKKYIEQFKNGTGFSDFYSSTGTPGYTEAGAESGDSPIKNWYGTPEDIKDFSGYKYEKMEKYIVKKGSCYKCPMADWKYVIIKDGPYKMTEKAHIPEYESASAFGSFCLNTNPESIIRCNDLCNRYGIDTISTGATIAFAMSCYQDGIINIKDTDGIKLTWGNHQAIVEMTEKIAKRDGFGDILADGVRLASEKIGKDSEKYAIHIGGQELPAHDPRFEPSMASIYLHDATPGRHGQASQYSVPPKLAELMPEVDFSYSFGNKRDIYTGRAKAQKVLSSLAHCVNAMGMCLWGYLSTEVTFMSECYSAVTGFDVDMKELLITGERIGTMRLAFGLREGKSIVERKIPDIAIGKPPLKNGPTKNISIDLKKIRGEYFQEMDYDINTGRPSNKKLKELGLGWLIEDFKLVQ